MKNIRHFGPGAKTYSKEWRRKYKRFADQYYTVVLGDCPTAEGCMNVITNSINSPEPIINYLNIGYARTHCEDQYNKKKGVEIAENRMKLVPFFVDFSFSCKNQEVSFYLYPKDIEHDIECLFLTVKLNQGTYPLISHVHFKNEAVYKREKK